MFYLGQLAQSILVYYNFCRYYTTAIIGQAKYSRFLRNFIIVSATYPKYYYRQLVIANECIMLFRCSFLKENDLFRSGSFDGNFEWTLDIGINDGIFEMEYVTNRQGKKSLELFKKIFVMGGLKPMIKITIIVISTEYPFNRAVECLSELNCDSNGREVEYYRISRLFQKRIQKEFENCQN